MKKIYSLLTTLLISIVSFAQKSGDTLQKQPPHNHLPEKLDADVKFNVQIRQWILDHPLPGIYDRTIEDISRTGAPVEGIYFIGYNSPGTQNYYHFISAFNEQKNKE